MLLTYEGSWGNVSPLIGGEDAPTNPFVANLHFPNGDVTRSLVYSCVTHGSVSDHGHDYPSQQRWLKFNVLLFGFVFDLTIPSGVRIEVLHTEGTRLFARGDYVLYVPGHAGGNLAHKDVERGVVSRVNDTTVFVKYGVDSPDADVTAKGSNPLQLIRI